MSIEYLLVSFSEQRAVLADGTAVGFTNHTMLLPGDEYLITLDGDGYQPLSQDVVLSGTSLVKPMVISFTPAAGAPAARAAAVAITSTAGSPATIISTVVAPAANAPAAQTPAANNPAASAPAANVPTARVPGAKPPVTRGPGAKKKDG